MESVKLFNGLNGSTVSRQYLFDLIQKAIAEEQTHIAKKLTEILLLNADERFEIEIEQPSVETIPLSLLNGLQLDDIQEENGLNKAVSTNDIYQMVTDKIIEALEQPLEDWQRTWGKDKEGYTLAYNFVSKKPYRSINQIILNPRLLSEKYPLLKNPYFLTFKQVTDLGGKVSKGAKGHVVTYYSFLYSCVFDELKVDFKTYDRDKFIDFIVKNNILARLKMNLPLNLFVEQSKIAFLKYYNVFNGVDVEGINFDLENFSLPGKLEAIENHHETIEICEQMIANYPAPKPKFTFGGESAHFIPSKDVINMPNLKQFEYVQAYYTTYFHEIIHSTGVAKRLDRDLTGQMKTADTELYVKYAFEELIAEIGAMFMSSQAGILHYTMKNSLAYVKGWRQNLLIILKENNKFVFRAATQSQKAVDFLLEGFEFVKKSKVQEKTKEVAKKAVKPKVEKAKPTEKEKVSEISKGKKVTKGKRKFIKVEDIVEGKSFLLVNDEIIVVKKVYTEKNNEVLVDIVRGGKTSISEINSLKIFFNNWKAVEIETPKNLEDNPKGFAIKPKSVAVATAITDVLSLPKFKGIKPLPANLLYNKFKTIENLDDDTSVQIESTYEIGILKNTGKLHYFHDYDNAVSLNPIGVEFINAVKGRLESLHNQKNNLALFDGLKKPAAKAKNKNKLNAPAEDKPTVEEGKPVVSLPAIPIQVNKYKTAVDRERENLEPKRLFNLKGDLAKFLGKIEIKPVQSMAITIDSGEGGGKTHTLYNWANEFFEAGYRPIIWSLEEHATSSLSTDKAEQYFGANKAYIPIESENENESSADVIRRMFDSVKDFDVIMIDSWAKVMELDKTINFDQDLRKKFHGKLFIVIFQRTSSGEMRGGSKGGFDGDVILKVIVDRDDFRNNYIYNHKNRYNDYMPISELKYSPYDRALLKTEKEILAEKPKLSFSVKEINE